MGPSAACETSALIDFYLLEKDNFCEGLRTSGNEFKPERCVFQQYEPISLGIESKLNDLFNLSYLKVLMSICHLLQLTYINK